LRPKDGNQDENRRGGSRAPRRWKNNLRKRKLGPKNLCHRRGSPHKFGKSLGTKPDVCRGIFGLRLSQRQSNHQGFGGSVWESKGHTNQLRLEPSRRCNPTLLPIGTNGTT